MSVQPSQSSGPSSGGGQPSDGDGRRFSTIVGSLAAATSNDEDTPPNRPTFTARPSGPAVAGTAEPADTPDAGAPAEPADTPGTDTVSSAATGTETSAPPEGRQSVRRASSASPVLPDQSALPDQPVPDPERTLGLPRPAAAPADGPLLSDAAGLRARWQRVQADFVDDPQEAVGNAADLIEQTAQALVGALRQRQRQLRIAWEGGPDPAREDGESAARAPDTEHLRLMMQRYRALFNQLCRS
jgi:hypothetical protein